LYIRRAIASSCSEFTQEWVYRQGYQQNSKVKRTTGGALLSVILKRAPLSADTKDQKFPALAPAICTLHEVSLFFANFASCSTLLFSGA
jgi:hypothetical protein